MKKRNGVWFVEGDIVLSEVLHEPGPTGDIFDVLAASVVVLSPGRRFALLGFGAGGIVAPLRALGSSHAIHAVDLDLQGEELFRRTARYPVGEVNVDQRDAIAWLRRERRHYDLILDDLSIPNGKDAIKPDMSAGELPSLISKRLRPGGVAIFNLLSHPHRSWSDVLKKAAAPFSHGLVVHFSDLDNKILLCGEDMGSAASVSREIRQRLRSIDSTALGWSLRTLV